MSGTNRLGITAGVFGSLALAVSASADFTGCQVELQGTYDTSLDAFGPDVGPVDVWNVYALFSEPLDQYIKTFVDANDANFDEMRLSSDVNAAFDGSGGGFWNMAAAGDTPQEAGFLYNLAPAGFDADTYLTIGLKSGTFTAGGDAAAFSSGSAAILGASGLLTTGGVICDTWEYSATPNDAQTFPIDGRVLFLQVAVLSGEHASGVWNIEWVNVTLSTGGASSLRMDDRSGGLRPWRRPVRRSQRNARLRRRGVLRRGVRSRPALLHRGVRVGPAMR